MEESGKTDQSETKVNEGRTFPVPFALGDLKGNIILHTNLYFF